MSMLNIRSTLKALAIFCFLFFSSKILALSKQPLFSPSPLIRVPGGLVEIGREIFVDGYNDQTPSHKVYLSAYLIEKYEVSNRQFCFFLNQMGNQQEEGVQWLCVDPGFSKIDLGNDNCYWVQSGWEDHPVVGVSWYGANAYAAWIGRRLPTEAEWEYASHGKENDPREASKGWYSTEAEPLDHEQPRNRCRPNHFGICDLRGNVLEWCADWYDKDYYKQSPRKNPQGPAAGTQKCARGGSWELGARFATPTFRLKYEPSTCNYDLGFRCAKSL